MGRHSAEEWLDREGRDTGPEVPINLVLPPNTPEAPGPLVPRTERGSSGFAPVEWGLG